MSFDPRKALTRHDPHGNAIVRIPPARPRDDYFPMGLFCASPTILEAINGVLKQRDMPVLWVQSDGTIGPTDPLLLTAHYVPSPFVC